jgi:DNA helicase-2/ATP-dependent DNA helicase PcrA
MSLNEWSENGTTFRYDKTIQPREEKFIDNPSVIKLGKSGTWEDYYEEVYQFISDLESKQVVTDRNQIAFLFRSVKNENIIGLANYLETKGIQIFSPRSALFFQRKEIQLLLGAIIFIFPTLFEDLKWNETAKLDIWETYEEWKKVFAEELRKEPERNKALIAWVQKRAKEHLRMEENTNYAFAALLYQLLEYPMFGEYLNVDLKDNKVNLRSAYNIAILSKLFFKFEYIYNITVFTKKNIQKTLQDFFNTYLRFILDGGLEEYEDFDEYAPSGCVSFMTIHQSKGLEFPVVFVGSLNSVPMKQYDEIEEILQNEFYLKPAFEPIEKIKFYDFWRLYYTAFSRPQNLLVLTAREVEGKGKSPSKYFESVYKT